MTESIALVTSTKIILLYVKTLGQRDPDKFNVNVNKFKWADSRVE